MAVVAFVAPSSILAALKSRAEGCSPSFSPRVRVTELV
jgi:hypothetical protein